MVQTHLYVLAALLISSVQIFSFLKISVVTLTLWVTGGLFLLNVLMAIIFRAQPVKERLSYYVVCALELVIFLFALALRLGFVTHVPYHLPPGLPFNRAEIGATIAVGLGLFPAAYWHRTSFSDLGTRMAADAKTIRERDGGVRIRDTGPGGWMN